MNMNDCVWVRLNAKGRKIHRQNFERLGITTFDYTPPEETNGWSKFQLWVLMSEFGRHVYNGCELPFVDTTIALTDPNTSDGEVNER